MKRLLLLLISLSLLYCGTANARSRLSGGTSHSKTLTSLSCGTEWLYYARCIDQSGNANLTSSTINFSIAAEVGDQVHSVSRGAKIRNILEE